MNERIEVRGRSEFRRRYVIMVARAGIVMFIILAVFFAVDLPDAPEKTILLATSLFIITLCALVSEITAHGERRNASPMTVDNEGIVLRNDYIDRLRGRPSRISWNDVERIDSYSSPSYGEGSGFLIIRTGDGKLVSTGAKISEDLEKALERVPPGIERVTH